MHGQSISLALLSVSGLVSSLPTEKRQVGSGDAISGVPLSDVSKRSIDIPPGTIFDECASINLKGVESAFTTLVDAYGLHPDTKTFVAMQPLQNIIQGCGVDTTERATLTVPTATAFVDVSPLEELYAQLEPLGQPVSLVELISMDSILSTIEMNKGVVSKRWEKRDAAAVSCSTGRINAWRLGLFTIAASYSGEIPISIWLIAENLVALLNSCGVTIDMKDIFGLGTPTAGGLEPDPTVPGGSIVPDPVTSGGSIVPDPVVSGGSMVPETPAASGSIVPDVPVSSSSMVPDPVVTATLTPDPVATSAATSTVVPGKRDGNFKVWPGLTSGMVPDKVVPGGQINPDPVYPGDPIVPDPIYTPPKEKRQFSLGNPIVGGLIPDQPSGNPSHFNPPTKEKRQIFSIGTPIVGDIVPDNTIPTPVVISPRDVKCNLPLYEAMLTLEATYGRACDGHLTPSILLAQQSLVVIIYRECGSLWDNWQLVNLNGGFVEIGPIYSSGVNPSE